MYGMPRRHKLGVGDIHYWGPWQIAYCGTEVLCSDGRRRYARITAEADTFFSIPASVNVKGKTVAGYITGREAEDGRRDYEFRAYTDRKNGSLLP